MAVAVGGEFSLPKAVPTLHSETQTIPLLDQYPETHQVPAGWEVGRAVLLHVLLILNQVCLGSIRHKR